MKLLFSLIKSSLWGIPVEEGTILLLKNLDGEGWQSLLDAAKGQTVSGLLYKALEKLPDGFILPENIFLQLMTRVNQIVNRNHLVSKVEKDTIDLLTQEGFHPIILKGSSCAARYPSPELRESGDIDLFLQENEFTGAVNRVQQSGLAYTKSPDASIVFTKDGVVVELHHSYYDLHIKPSLLPDIATPEAELVMLSGHILKHACGVGVGLRQICDFALAYHAFPGDKKKLDEAFRKAGLEKGNQLLLSFIGEYLGLEKPEKPINPRPLLRIINSGGNFGHHASSRQEELGRSTIRRKARTALRLISRLPFSLRFAPREAFSTLRQLVKGNLEH